MSVVALEKRRITLPREIWETLGLEEGDKIRVILEGNRLVLTPVSASDRADWRRWRGRLAGTKALQEHMSDHAEEVARERLP